MLIHHRVGELPATLRALPVVATCCLETIIAKIKKSFPARAKDRPFFPLPFHGDNRSLQCVDCSGAKP